MTTAAEYYDEGQRALNEGRHLAAIFSFEQAWKTAEQDEKEAKTFDQSRIDKAMSLKARYAEAEAHFAYGEMFGSPSNPQARVQFLLALDKFSVARARGYAPPPRGILDKLAEVLIARGALEKKASQEKIENYDRLILLWDVEAEKDQVKYKNICWSQVLSCLNYALRLEHDAKYLIKACECLNTCLAVTPENKDSAADRYLMYYQYAQAAQALGNEHLARLCYQEAVRLKSQYPKITDTSAQKQLSKIHWRQAGIGAISIFSGGGAGVGLAFLLLSLSATPVGWAMVVAVIAGICVAAAVGGLALMLRGHLKSAELPGRPVQGSAYVPAQPKIAPSRSSDQPVDYVSVQVVKPGESLPGNDQVSGKEQRPTKL